MVHFNCLQSVVIKFQTCELGTQNRYSRRLTVDC